MKKIAAIFLIIVLSQIKIHAQPEYDFSGYVVDLPIVQFTNSKLAKLFGTKENQFLNLTRVRLRPTMYLWDGARINAEYEIAALYFNSLNTFSLTTTGGNSRQLLDLTWKPVDKKNFTVTHLIDRLYFRQGFNWGDVEIGRQRISWGTGRVWNPTDLFNPINPAAYYKLEKDGADIVSLKYIFGNFTDLQLVYNPLKKIKDSNYGFRFRTNYDTYDVSFIGGRFDKRIVAGMDFAGNFFDAGLRGEGIYSVNEDDGSDNFVKYILGIDYQFTSKLYAMLEYHFNGQGKTNKNSYDLGALVNGRILNLNKDYLATTVSYQLTPLITAALSNIININDGSGYAGITFDYSMEQNFYLNFGSQITYGKEFTEYWYYPRSVYLEGQYYF